MGEERRQCQSEEDNTKAIPACPIVKTLRVAYVLEVH